jgi:hypothetical protein
MVDEDSTTRSPHRNDVAACHAIQSVTLRRPAIFALRLTGGVFSMSKRDPPTL